MFQLWIEVYTATQMRRRQHVCLATYLIDDDELDDTDELIPSEERNGSDMVNEGEFLSLESW